MADMNRHFGRVRPRNQIGRAEHVEKFRVREPSAPPHEFLFHHRDVSRGSAEGGCAEPQKRNRDFP